MKGYSVCGQFIGVGARWHYTLFRSGDLIRSWWPGEGVWGHAEEWTHEGWRRIREDEISSLFPMQSDSLQ